MPKTVKLVVKGFRPLSVYQRIEELFRRREIVFEDWVGSHAACEAIPDDTVWRMEENPS